MRAEAGEMLPGGHLDHPQGAEADAAEQGHSAMVEVPHQGGDETGNEAWPHVGKIRDDRIGERQRRITPAELYLEVVNNNASADEMIPFVEIAEVQVRHKDSL